MEYVKEDKEWYLMSEYDCPGLSEAYGEEYKILYEKYVSEGKYMKSIKAKEIWESMMTS
jgi:ribonucleoside-diphosphate reductase alpha chain